MRSLILAPAAFLTALALAGCYEKEADASLGRPAEHSPNYGYVTRVAENGRTKKVLVPEACMAAEAPSPAGDEPQRLPPGCANAYNLQRMVERKKDLTNGRPLGPAAAGPAARAARDYIDGTDERALGGAVRNSEPQDRATETSEPQRPR
jgi:hypothetical protein